MRTIEQLLAEHPFFADLPADVLADLVGCGENVHVAEGSYLFHAGEPADRFYVIRHGLVALELAGAGARPRIIDTTEDGEVVGWSWLVPPYRWFFDARAVQPTSAVALDGACLRGKCQEDPRLGYELLRRVAGVMYQRMQAARVRLLDLYGVPGGGNR